MGHLTRMANNVAGNRTVGTLNRTREESTEEAPADTNLTNALDEVHFNVGMSSQPLAEINKKNNTNLVSCSHIRHSVYCNCAQGGNRPLTSSFEDSDEDFDQLNQIMSFSLLLCLHTSHRNPCKTMCCMDSCFNTQNYTLSF